MFCTKCGKQLTENAVFCTGCGSPVGNVKMQATSQNTEKTVVSSQNKPIHIVVLTVVALLAIALVLTVGILFLNKMTVNSNSESIADNNLQDSVEVQASVEELPDYTDENDSWDSERIDETGLADEETGMETDSSNSTVRKPGEVIITPSNDYGDHTNTDEELEEDDTVVQGDYLLPESDTKRLTISDLQGLTAEECRIARNEIYARHGRRFTDEELQAYFDSKDWYVGTISPDDFKESMLSDIETANRDTIIEYEKKLGYR